MPAYDDNPDLKGDYVWIKAENTAGRNGPDRRSRASQVTAHKLRYQREHGVTLEKLTTSYDEAFGFLHQTAVRYKIIRPEVTPVPEPAAPKLTTIPTHLPAKPAPKLEGNHHQRRVQRRSGGYSDVSRMLAHA